MNRFKTTLFIMVCAYASACSDSMPVSSPTADASKDVIEDSGAPDVPPDVPQDVGQEIDVITNPCVLHTDCKAKAKPCQSWYCDSPDGVTIGQCQYTFVDTLTPCDDGNVCTQIDKCNSSHVCQGGGALDCQDGSQCTQDSCDPISGCLHVKIDIPCDDGSACTTSDKCTNGLCVGKNVVCDDGDQCTLDKCVEDKGCVNDKQTNVACDDGDMCTKNDACQKGMCVGEPDPCDDGNPCTYNKCDKVNGCSFQPVSNGNVCEDGDKCTQNDTCQNSMCASGKKKNCDDNNNVCTADSCESATGDCIHKPIEGAYYCDDKSVCTQNDLCTNGVCAGKPVSCDDVNDCTSDSCDALTGCFHKNMDGAACDDGKWCTLSDKCTGKTCAGQVNTCEDGNVCTKDSCDNAAATCYHTAFSGFSCNDGNACTLADECSGTICAGTVYKCDDGNSCTDDSCNQLTGCTNKPTDGAPCSDGNACTFGDTCNKDICFSKPPISCNDANKCTTDSCDPSTGKCVFTPIACDDNNKCTNDSCDLGTGKCVFTLIANCVP